MQTTTFLYLSLLVWKNYRHTEWALSHPFISHFSAEVQLIWKMWLIGIYYEDFWILSRIFFYWKFWTFSKFFGDVRFVPENKRACIAQPCIRACAIAYISNIHSCYVTLDFWNFPSAYCLYKEEECKDIFWSHRWH